MEDVIRQMDEDQDSVVNNTPDVITTVTEELSQEDCGDTEDENKESEEAETNIPVNEGKSDENTDKSDTDDKQDVYKRQVSC